jgi:hypothetical protein
MTPRRRLWLPILAACGCFVPGTPIATPTGPKPIEDLQVGDEVWSWSFERAALVRSPVETVHRRVVEATLELRLDAGGRSMVVTPDHPFWSVSDAAWRRADQLRRGETLWRLTGRDVAAVSIEDLVRRLGRIEVLNLGVTRYRNYFAAGVLVHNKEAPGSTRASKPPIPSDFDQDAYTYVEDCDDADPEVNPDATEVCDDGIDDDCDGDVDDADEDCAP